MLNAYGVQRLLEIYVNNLAGKVNIKFPLIAYRFSYDPKAKICAGERHGVVTFYPEKLMVDFVETTPNYYELKSWLLMITVHELSHIDQGIDYNKYCEDDAYKKEIEESNEKHTREWIFNNLAYLHTAFGDFVDLPCWGSYDYTKNSLITDYEIANNSLYVKNLLVNYLPEEYEKYSDLYVTIHAFDEITFMIRDNYKWINIESLTKVINWIESAFDENRKAFTLPNTLHIYTGIPKMKQIFFR